MGIHSLTLISSCFSLHLANVSTASLVSAFVVVVASYMAIHTRLKLTVPSLEAHNRRSAEQTAKLSCILFIVIALSLSLWLPSIVLYT